MLVSLAFPVIISRLIEIRTVSSIFYWKLGSTYMVAKFSDYSEERRFEPLYDLREKVTSRAWRPDSGSQLLLGEPPSCLPSGARALLGKCASGVVWGLVRNLTTSYCCLLSL